MGKLYIDFSETHFSKLNTGIQRVVRNIVSRKEFFLDHGFDEVIAVVQVCGSFYRLELGEELPFCLRRIVFLLATRMRNFLDDCFFATGRMLDKRKKGWQGTLDGKTSGGSVDRKEDPTTVRMRVVLLCRRIMKIVYLAVEFIDALFLREQKIHFKNTDLLFLPDAFWPDSFSNSAVAKAKKRGVKVVTLIHDIFPITHSHLVEEKNRSNFKSKFPMIDCQTDGYIFNSEFTQTEVLQYLRDKDSSASDVVSDFFHLGADLGESFGDGFPFRREKIYLMVGTIEPRKNHAFVLQAFHRYWELGGEGCLVIVGKIGWKCEEVLDVIHNSPFLDKHLFCFYQVSDRELVKFYSNCTALIFSSIVEGFGLPIVEAMSYGRTVLASDIPVFREIAGDYPFYFDLGNPNSLLDLLYQLESESGASGRPIPEFISWDCSIRQLSAKLGKLQKRLA
jgi:alpha-1,2-rhamnosyltransferase